MSTTPDPRSDPLSWRGARKRATEREREIVALGAERERHHKRRRAEQDEAMRQSQEAEARRRAERARLLQSMTSEDDEILRKLADE